MPLNFSLSLSSLNKPPCLTSKFPIQLDSFPLSWMLSCSLYCLILYLSYWSIFFSWTANRFLCIGMLNWGIYILWIIQEEMWSSSVHFSHSVMSDSLGPHGLAACQASLSITNSQSLLTLISIESVMPSKHLIICHPLILPPLIFPSIRIFSSKSVLLIRWPNYWSFSFSFRPSNEYSGLISFRIDLFDLLVVQGTLKSLL